jgi:hypothetical protein
MFRMSQLDEIMMCQYGVNREANTRKANFIELSNRAFHYHSIIEKICMTAEMPLVLTARADLAASADIVQYCLDRINCDEV